MKPHAARGDFSKREFDHTEISVPLCFEKIHVNRFSGNVFSIRLYVSYLKALHGFNVILVVYSKRYGIYLFLATGFSWLLLGHEAQNEFNTTKFCFQLFLLY
jgi:hypothetical protein